MAVGMDPQVTEYEVRRRQMVETQLRGRGISDERVLEAFRKVPRHRFVPQESWKQAYDDCPLPIGDGQTISQPYMVAAMTEALDLKGDERVLEVGTGSGYQAAILAELAGEVYSIETIERLSERARRVLEELGYENVSCAVGDGSQGYPPAAPFDAILVTAAAPSIPQALVEQLEEEGRLVIPVGDIASQELVLVQKAGNRTSQQTINYCRFVPLTGKYGWGGSSSVQ